MPEDVDRALARLVVDSGLLSRDEAAGYWRQSQAPGSPRFVAALLQSGRITQADVERLRVLYQQQQGGNGPTTGALPRPATSSYGQPAALPPATNSYGPPPGTNSYGPPPTPTGSFAAAPQGSTTTNSYGAPPGADALADNEGTWEEQVARDAQLARVLFSRGLTTQDRLRECRELQIKHRVRLGLVLVKKGYVERTAVTEALASVRGPAPGTVQGATPLGPVFPPPASARHVRNDFGPPPSANPDVGMANPFAVPIGGPVDQDAMPTLNVGPGGIPGFPGMGGRSIPPGMTPPGASPQDAIATITGVQSVDEMNPFASVSAPGGARPQFPGMPLQPMLSGDELNAFDNVPLAPLGSVRGGQSPLLQSTRGGSSGGSNPVNGWGAPPGQQPIGGPVGFDLGPGPGQGMFSTPPVIGGHGADTTQGPAAGAEHAPAPADLISSAAQKSKTKSKAKKAADAPGMSTGKLLAIVVGAGLLLLLAVLGLLWAIL